MKIYQMIYTATKYSLSDKSKGLTNTSGKCVYSCSEELTKENIDELIRFSSYKMLKAPDIQYSKTPCDPSVPELFPKTFRTLKLSDGRYAAIQAVYSSCDFNGERGNSFAHALVFDEFSDAFFPEQYYKSEIFKTHLTREEQEGQLVKYLPTLTVDENDTLIDTVSEFIKSHRSEMGYLINRAIGLLTGTAIKNICIATSSSDLSDMYLIALKYLLPRDISRYTGISTYNVYIPSDKQDNIVFHATIKGRNNISEESIKAQKNCLYIDMDNINYTDEEILSVIDFDLKILQERYKVSNIKSVSAFLDWCSTYSGELKKGIGAKLISLLRSGGEDVLRERLNELYAVYRDDAHKDVRFEILKTLFDNAKLLENNQKDITLSYIGECVEMMCNGTDFAIYECAHNITDTMSQIIADNIGEYIKRVYDTLDSLSEFNKNAFIEFFALIKHSAKKKTWKELFKNDTDRLSAFIILISGQVIKGRGAYMFEEPKSFNISDMAEVVAYIHSSTDDEVIKYGCVKYILTYPGEDWDAYGITIKSREKTRDEQNDDLERVKKMLRHIGYYPFEKSRYEHLRSTVRNDMSQNLNPLLLSRVLDAYYNWSAASGRQTKAKKKARILRDLIIELRMKEREVYDFIFPKLALEIIETTGHYHDKIISPKTMTNSFWHWFLIGYQRAADNEMLILNYNRIYLSHKEELLKTTAGRALKEAFSQVR